METGPTLGGYHPDSDGWRSECQGLRQIVLAERGSVDLAGIHGLPHWRRVRRFSRALVARRPGRARYQRVIDLFPDLHDAWRVSDGHDPRHGARAAEWVREHRESLAIRHLSQDEFATLDYALRNHCESGAGADPGLGAARGLGASLQDALRMRAVQTVEICWDSDRLDYGRTGIEVDPGELYTPEAIAMVSR